MEYVLKRVSHAWISKDSSFVWDIGKPSAGFENVAVKEEKKEKLSAFLIIMNVSL